MEVPVRESLLWRILPARYILSVFGSIGFAIVYGLKVNLSVAMVGMLNHTALKKAQGDSDAHGSGGPGECTAPGGSSNATELDGPFTWSSEVQGIVLSCYFWGYFISQLPAARIAELYSAKWVMFFSVFINVVCTLLTPVMCNLHYSGVVLMRIGEGIGGGVTFPAMHTMLSKWAPPSERSFMAALTYAGTSLGTVISMLMAGVLTANIGWESVFYVMGGLSLIWCVLWVVLVQDTPQQQRFMNADERTMILQALGNQENQGQKHKHPMPWGAAFKSPAFLAILIAHTCSNFGWYMVLIELPFYMKQVLKFNMTEMGGPNKKFRYCVIKLKKAGEPWLDPYICVPYSWLRLHKKSLIVKYPQESKSLTTYRVKHCEISQPNWSTFGADIKYKTDSYVDAQMCLRKLLQGYREKNALQDNKPTTSNETGKFDVKIFGTQNKRNEIQKSNNSDDDSTESEDEVSESQATNQLTTKTIDKQHKTVSYKKVNGNKVVPKLIIKKVKPIKYKFKSKLVVETPPKSTETGKNKSSTEQNSSDSEAANNATDNETASGPLNPRTMAIVNLWKTIQDQISFIEQLEESDKQINGIVDKMSTSIKAVDTLKDLIDQLEALEDEIEDEEEEEEATKVESGTGQLAGDIIQEAEKEEEIEEENEEDIDEEKKVEEIDEEEKEEEEEEVEEKEEEEEVEEKEEEEIVVEKNEEKEDAKEEEKQVATEEEKQDEKEEEKGEEDGEDGSQNENAQTINLPPEYDENDTRWTLKYKNYTSGLSELMESSRIYVNFENLAAIVVKCQNQKQLARNLLSEVFTKNALSVCKFPQPVSVPSHRPDLDIGGIKAILDFVQKHTAVVNWPYVSPKIIKLSLRGKLSYAHKKFKRTGRFT